VHLHQKARDKDSSTKTALHKRHLRIHGNHCMKLWKSTAVQEIYTKQKSSVGYQKCIDDEFWPWFFIGHIIRFGIHYTSLQTQEKP